MLLRICQGKGHKDRVAPLSPMALDLLRQWWRATHPKDLLFPNQNDASRPLSPATVQRAVKLAARQAGITKRVSPHTLESPLSRMRRPGPPAVARRATR